MDDLTARYEAMESEYTNVLNRCALDGRDLSPDELERGRQMAMLGDRIVEVREQETRRSAGTRFMAGKPSVSKDAPMVRIRSEAEVYRPADASSGPRLSFFSDLLHSQIDGDVECRSRINRHTEMHTRAVGTTGTAPGVVPPTWLFNEFAIIAHGARPWAEQARRIPVDNANPVQIGQQTGGAVVSAQASEGAAAADGSFVAGVLTVNPTTYTGKVDVSRQIIDGGMPAVDGLVYADCMGAYNEAVEQAFVNALEALAPPVVITYPGTYTNLPDAFIDANASTVKRRKLASTTILVSAGAWAYMVKQKDTNGRPLITTGDFGPTNAYGVGTQSQYEGLAGEVAGLKVFPSWAGVDNHLYSVVADDLLLLESNTFNFRYEEVLGPSAVRLGVWGYAAPVVNRYAASVVRINAGTTIPAPAELEAESAEEAEEEGPGSGPGTPRRRRR
jgi:HK97 family phage major capsid protein